MLTSPVTSLVELHLSGLPIELNISCLSFTYHDRRLEMDVNKHDQLMSTWLEEEVLDVAEQYIDVFVAEGGNIAQTVLMYFDFARYSFTIERRS